MFLVLGKTSLRDFCTQLSLGRLFMSGTQVTKARGKDTYLSYHLRRKWTHKEGSVYTTLKCWKASSQSNFWTIQSKMDGPYFSLQSPPYLLSSFVFFLPTTQLLPPTTQHDATTLQCGTRRHPPAPLSALPWLALPLRFDD